ncbi:MAG: hypothetical protein M3O61_15905 [Gemmatimonadota bacterium]|nr:hypothetical protein [Gemmatimonadota bacterium]
MARSKKGKAVRDLVEEGEGKSREGGPPTSRNREESMTESGDDEFQNPRSSGTTPLGGESGSADPNSGPGGVEGTRGDE